MLSLLRTANRARQDRWPGKENFGLMFRSTELGSEVGEAQGECKKLYLERHEVLQPSKDRSITEPQRISRVAAELADVIICADLIASDLDIDLWRAVINKFNSRSRDLNIDVIISEHRVLLDDEAALPRD